MLHRFPYLLLSSFCLALAVVHPSGQGADFLVYRYGEWGSLAWVYPVWAKVLFLPYHLLPLTIAWGVYLATLLASIGYCIHYWQLAPYHALAIPLWLTLYVGQCDPYLALGICLTHKGLAVASSRWLGLGLFLLSIKPHFGLVLAVVLLDAIPCAFRVKMRAYGAMLVVMGASVLWWHEWELVLAHSRTTYLQSNNLVWDSIGVGGLPLLGVGLYRGWTVQTRLIATGVACWLCLPYFSFSNLSILILFPMSGWVAMLAGGLVLKLVLPSIWVDYGLQMATVGYKFCKLQIIMVFFKGYYRKVLWSE